MKRRSKRRTSIASVLSAAGVSLLLAPPVQADVYWKGGTADFDTASAWNTGSVPVAGNFADVYNAGVVTITTAQSVSDLRVGTGGAVGLQTGTGSVVQLAGSTVTVSSWLRVSSFDHSGGTGNYTLNGGDLQVSTGYVNIGESGTGVMNVNGGTFEANAPTNYDFEIGGVRQETTGTGTLNVNGGVVSTSDVLLVGAFNNSHGTLNVSGGTFNCTGGAIGDGNQPGTVGAINLLAGAFNVSGSGGFYIGNNNTATGVLNVTGGAVNLLAANDANILEIGSATGGTGTVNVTGTGVINSTDSEVWVGKYGTGTLNVNSGGTITVGEWIAIGRNGGSGTVNLGPGGTITKAVGSPGEVTFAGANDLLNQTGGTLNNVGSETWMGESGTSTYNMSGGTANLAALILARNVSTSAVVNLTGGTLSVTQVEMGAGTSGVLNFNGGTLQASPATNGATARTFVNGLSAANVLAGGAVVDTNGQNVVISQGLLHGTTASIDGGLTKLGAGNLTLAAAGTYTGGTAVTAGTLTVANPTAAGNGTITLTGNSTLALSAAGTIYGFPNETLNGGATLGGDGLTLTDGALGESRSAFNSTPVAIYDQMGFSAHFVWTSVKATGLADGVVFTVQNDPRGPAALGDNGLAIGYGSQNGSGNAIIHSGAVAIDTYNNPGTTGSGTGITDGINGVLMTRTTANGIAASGNPVEVDVTYAAGDLHLMLTDLVLGTTVSADYAMDFNALLGGTSGYVGLTGATGAQSSSQTIHGFSFTNNVSTPVSIANAVTAAAGTRSVIQISAAVGQTAAAVGPITVTAGSSLNLSAMGVGTVPQAVLIASSLKIAGSTNAWTGTFDVGRNALDVTTADLSTVTNQVASGFHLAAGGTWNGTGITSSAAAADVSHLTAVGVIQNDQGGTAIYSAKDLFDGIAPGPSDVLVKYTYFGDANLDGEVDGSDYSLIDHGFAVAGSAGWYNGDFNYDGAVDGADYTLIDDAYNRQGTPLSSAERLASPTALVVAAATSPVPEPALAGLILNFAVMPMLRRRRASERGPAKTGLGTHPSAGDST